MVETSDTPEIAALKAAIEHIEAAVGVLKTLLEALWIKQELARRREKGDSDA